MSEKKVVSRSVAIALGIMCVVLLILLVGNIMTFSSQISDLKNQISTNNSQISSLNSRVSDLTDIVNLAKSTIWVNRQTISQPAGSYTHWTPAFSASYAGYVSVQVHTSTTSKTYVQVIYSSHGVDYDQQITVGASGTAVFPVLPSSAIEIRVGNTNLTSGATQTVTITYYY
jgi:hypothetical protein